MHWLVVMQAAFEEFLGQRVFKILLHRAAHRARVRAELGVAEREALFLYVGSGYERKGVPRLLQACARMSCKEARLCVVGADKNEARCRRQAHALGLSGRVRFLGARKDVEPWYGAADAFVLPTLYDPFPNAALEALACGLPVVAFDTGSLSELVPAGAGYIGPYGSDSWKLEPPDVTGLVDGAEKILMDWPAYSQAARLRAESALGLEHMLDGYLEALLEK